MQRQIVVPTRDVFAAMPAHLELLRSKGVDLEMTMDLAVEAWHTHVVVGHYEELYKFCQTYLFLRGFYEIQDQATCEELSACLVEIVELLCKRMDLYLRNLVFNDENYGVETVVLERFLGEDAVVRVDAFELLKSDS